VLRVDGLQVPDCQELSKQFQGPLEVAWLEEVRLPDGIKAGNPKVGIRVKKLRVPLIPVDKPRLVTQRNVRYGKGSASSLPVCLGLPAHSSQSSCGELQRGHLDVQSIVES
jgi:hypothetical protein